ncbi:YafY family transcriptional regulator [Affinibrenneria salicis]|uniref:YafY family transcriptional regulator n=1 Tax=Affinibrenneria salicis TaxID=2590031 RepID=A0A5J5FZ66_9GAMM|nr:YafY family protein [Affinibrenneria salicis]KAA8999399.1 YafY family transcriptional regulator [Affinibrenneria salicis]
MSRSQRLLELLQLLRQHRFPVTGAWLAQTLNISLRTLYRDIRTLQEQGATIEGAAGLGYVLRPGFLLPPMMFSEEEIEALALGSRWVAARGDRYLSAAAQTALTKISAVLPEELQRRLDSSGLLIGPGEASATSDELLYQLRLTIRSEAKIHIAYCDLQGRASSRTIWPLALGYFDQVMILVAWCELRRDFRHFRTDRIDAVTLEHQRYPQRRQILLHEWKKRHRQSPARSEETQSQG